MHNAARPREIRLHGAMIASISSAPNQQNHPADLIDAGRACARQVCVSTCALGRLTMLLQQQRAISHTEMQSLARDDRVTCIAP